ncbi:hypothetical protein [Cupriavidus oxalaticus]|uniref:hypothetical protein n=1 Tax=Cupriavidus oxalaticus TaxID=96344 RepID=UPI003F738973
MNDGSFTALASAEAVMLAGLVVLLVMVFAIFRSVRHVLSMPDGRAARAQAMLWVWAKSAAAVIGAVVVSYGLDARQRLRAGNCQREASPQESGAYLGEICLPPARGTGRLRLRLYSVPDGVLLAERMYEHPEPRLIWTQDELIYDTAASDGKGSVRLPPTWWDRLKAKLP